MTSRLTNRSSVIDNRSTIEPQSGYAYRLHAAIVNMNQHSKHLGEKSLNSKSCYSGTQTHIRHTALPRPLNWSKMVKDD